MIPFQLVLLNVSSVPLSFQDGEQSPDSLTIFLEAPSTNIMTLPKPPLPSAMIKDVDLTADLYLSVTAPIASPVVNFLAGDWDTESLNAVDVGS